MPSIKGINFKITAFFTAPPNAMETFPVIGKLSFVDDFMKCVNLPIRGGGGGRMGPSSSESSVKVRYYKP